MLHGPKRTQILARELRRAMSLPEALLWRELRRRPGGLKFRRQHPAGHFILDFYCAEAHLALEIDGEIHARGDNPGRDATRDAWLRSQSVRVCRIPAREVLADLDAVVRHIIDAARGDYPSTAFGGPPPPPGGGMSQRFVQWPQWGRKPPGGSLIDLPPRTNPGPACHFACPRI